MSWREFLHRTDKEDTGMPQIPLYVRMHWRELLHRTDREDTDMPQRPHALKRIPPQNRYRGYRHASVRPHALARIPPQNRQGGYRHASTSAWVRENSSTEQIQRIQACLNVRMSWREFLHRTDTEDTEHASASPCVGENSCLEQKQRIQACLNVRMYRWEFPAQRYRGYKWHRACLYTSLDTSQRIPSQRYWGYRVPCRWHRACLYLYGWIREISFAEFAKGKNFLRAKPYKTNHFAV